MHAGAWSFALVAPSISQFGLSVLDRIVPLDLETTSMAGRVWRADGWHNYRHHTGDIRSGGIFSVS